MAFYIYNALIWPIHLKISPNDKRSYAAECIGLLLYWAMTSISIIHISVSDCGRNRVSNSKSRAYSIIRIALLYTLTSVSNATLFTISPYFKIILKLQLNCYHVVYWVGQGEVEMS
jgi:hypothetical protein